MNTIRITRVTAADLEQLQILSRRTFFETFAGGNTEENMKQYLDEAFSAEKMEGELNNPESEFYFALLDEKPVGYLKINFGAAQTEWQDPNAMEIERIYVIKEFHGRKVGQRLSDLALDIARKRNMDHVWLGVWEENPRAIAFYKKNGFVEFDKHLFRLGEDEQTDILMKRPLNELMS